MRQAIILAGGKGTRLAARLGGRPKPLVDLGGRPLLEHQLRLLHRFRFEQVLVLVNHRAEQIVEFIDLHRGFGMDVRCIDDGEPLGTAGATLAILDRLEPETLVVYGDTMLEVDLDRFHAFHAQEPGTAATLFLHPNDHPHDSDLVELDDDGRVVAFHPYPHAAGRDHANLVNAALYWVARDALAPHRGRPGPLDFGKDLFPAMLAGGASLRGYNSPEYIKDCGTPERLDKVERHLGSGRIARSSLAHPQAVVFVDRDGTLNEEISHLKHPDQLRLLPGVAEAVRRLNGSEYRVCVATNQPVVARGDVSFAELRAIHDRLETLLGRGGAYLDRIYVCPHHPHRGYAGERPELKIDCACRKPGTGMVDRAGGDFNLDRARSWFVGDTTVDVETARRAGLRSVVVETGYGGRDGRHAVEADYVVPGFGEAVHLILDAHPRLLARCEALDVAPGTVALIEGRARSGKGTLAAGLREVLARRGVTAHRVSVDRWLGAPDLGGAAALGALVERLAAASWGPVELPVPGEAAVVVAPGDAVLIEGAGAHALAGVGGPRARRLWLDTDEERRRARARGAAEARPVPPGAGRMDPEAPAEGVERLTLDEVLA
jgi:histidinol-phosphate phosphatase family protein